MMTREGYINLMNQIDGLIGVFEQHPDPVVQEQVVSLLSGLDALHREGLTRFVASLRDAGFEHLVDRTAEDPIIRIFLGLYDLVELDVPDEEQPPTGSGFIPVDKISVLGDDER